MRVRQVQKLVIESSTLGFGIQSTDQVPFLANTLSRFDALPSADISLQPQTFETFDCSDYSSMRDYSDVRLSPSTFEEVRYDISLGIPLIFSISQNAEKFLLRTPTLKKTIFDACDIIANFISAKDLKTIGEISFFQEDESEPKLFISYGILNKRYDEILKLWDEACEELISSIPVESLEKIALIFEQF